ncbi:class I SAM-dependent methyltransferase [Evansella halocellulosilytica]|uniref:class I SAM-dependent methyltransferase n=1 Tax=Evansella halocellulosilytica TaxID=2011013 RepID=UPI000BB6CA7F|nr:class I SAM-dependent methyltransferase [Evansella halocellulosilytica]
MKNDHLYKQTAKLYDLDPRAIVQDDLIYYEKMAENYPGDILELACGTGRVLLHLAKNGYKITGLDMSKEMLDILKEKLMKQKRHCT